MKKEEEQFLQQAERELAGLLAEVSEADIRHGWKRRTLEQERALLEAKLGAFEVQCDELAAQFEELAEAEQEEEEAEQDPEAWLRGARMELNEIICEVEGPRPRLLPKRTPAKPQPREQSPAVRRRIRQQKAAAEAKKAREG